MEEEVDQVVAEGIVPPEMVFEPEDGESERIVLRGGVLVGVGIGEGGPDAGQAGESFDLGGDGADVLVVVPDEGAVDGGEEGDEDEQCEQAGPEVPVRSAGRVVGESEDEGLGG